MALGYSLYVDGTRVFYNNAGFNIEITEDHFVDMTGSSTGSYTYTEGQYLGWTTTQGGTTPDYVVGDIISVGSGTVNLYSIAALSIVNIVLGNNTLNGVDTIKVTDANDTTNKVDFVYGTTPSTTTSIKIGNSTLNNVNAISVMGSDSSYKSFGYKPSGMTIYLKATGDSGTYSYYKVNDGEETLIRVNQEVTLTDVTKLDIYINADDVGELFIGTTGFESYDIYNTNTHFEWVDITQYLQNGCYVALRAND